MPLPTVGVSDPQQWAAAVPRPLSVTCHAIFSQKCAQNPINFNVLAKVSGGATGRKQAIHC
jgi:hypothetical protein